MTSTTSPPSTSPSKPGRRPRKHVEGVEPGKKPKKVNSEIRKQQNRIASRNYREKRKQKLQYLQRLLRDDQETSTSPESTHEEQERSGSAEFCSPSPAFNTMALPPNSEFGSISTASGNTTDTGLDNVTMSYENNFLPTSGPYNSFQPAWHSPMYDTQPQMNLPAWNVAQWLPSIDFTSQTCTPFPDDFQYSPPPTMQIFDSMSTPPLHAQESFTDADLYIRSTYDVYNRSPCQQQGPQGINMPSPSRYNPRPYYNSSL